MRTCSIQVMGLVQGVFFRINAKKKADELGVTGWVRNSEEQTDIVEILAQGEENIINTFIQWCYKGPEKADVHSVVIADETVNTLQSFEIIG